jgi:glycosyltransferase involved in cell wall biosynthesis
MRVLIFSHGHPTFSKGGGELAALYLFQGINANPEHEAWFVGRAPENLMHIGVPVASMNDREYLISGDADIQDLSATIALGDDSAFADMLRTIKPDVIHFHHYICLGVEMIRAAKRVCPEARIIITLHEYIAICMNNGQMVKTDGRLCHHYSPRECHLCFPDKSPEDFFLRELYIKSFFNLVDKFISPSDFLRNRYVAWGIDAERIEVIENGLPKGDKVPVRPLYSDDIRGRFAYFGQINPYKGVDVILEAFARLPLKVRKQVSLDIFGSALENQSPEFQEKVQGLLLKLKDTVRLHGPYEPEELGRLMSEVDWVVMGSIWWENSPLVIQEAYKFGRPVICPDIGGMAEKVKPGVGGLNFRARDRVSLASVINRVVEEPGLFEQLLQSLPEYPMVNEITEKHIHMYQELDD